MQNNAYPMKDMEIMTDLLTSQKTITENYNNYANECASKELKNSFLNILQEEHQIQADVFQVMNQRGWYKTQPADQNQLSTTKQKFESMQQQMQSGGQSQESRRSVQSGQN